MDSRTLMQKADLAVSNLISDGGYLSAEQSNKFIEILHNAPTMINDVRKVTMNSPVRKIPKIGFGSRILRAAPAAGQSLLEAERSKPDLGEVELTTSEVIAEVHIPYDALEDNIEGPGLENTILNLMGGRASLDLEELLILGDTTSSDTYLALQNGVIANTASANIIDASAITDVTKSLFKLGIHAMPDAYLRNRAALKFYVSTGVETEYVDSLTGRATALGDNKITSWTPSPAYGIEVRPAALMPDTKVFMSDPMNAIFGIQRDIMIETDKDIRARTIIIVMTMRVALALEEPLAAVVLKDFTDTAL